MASERVVCPTCATEGERSQVYPGVATSTLMGFSDFYDEEGVYHSHDPNRTTQTFRCSRGHSWGVSRLSPCPNCSYAEPTPGDGEAR